MKRTKKRKRQPKLFNKYLLYYFNETCRILAKLTGRTRIEVGIQVLEALRDDELKNK